MPKNKRFDGAAIVKGLVPEASSTRRGKPHKPYTPPPVITSPRSQKARGRSGKVKITGKASGNRMLAARKILVTRPELLAMLDLFPLYDGSGKNSRAGDLFDLRISLRDSALDAVEDSLTQVEADEAMAPHLAFAITQYESTLAAIFAENSFLQLVFLLRKYAERSTNWTDFVDSWSPNPDYHTDWIGENFEDFMKNVMRFKPPNNFSGEGAFLYDEDSGAYTDSIEYWDMGILSLLQLILDLSFSTAVTIPSISTIARGKQYRRITDPFISFGYNTGNNLENKLEPVTAWCAYQLQVSKIYAQIAKGEVDDLDEELVTALQNSVDSKFFSATTDPIIASQEFKGFFGIDPFSGTRRQLNKYREREKARYYVDEILSKGRKGAVSKLYEHASRTMYVHDYDIKIKKKNKNYRTYGNIIKEVDNAFESETPLDFTNYKKAVDGLKELGDAATNWKKLYRLLDQKNLSDDEIPSGIPALSEEHPLSPASIYLKALQIFQNRVINKLYSGLRLGLAAREEAKDGDTEAINYVKMMAYVLWYQMPDRGEKWVQDVWQDYIDGFLTAQAVPQEIENDEGDMVMEDPVWVSPITGQTLDAFARSTSLMGHLKKPWDTFMEGDFYQFNSQMGFRGDVVLLSDSYSDFGVGDIEDACDRIETKRIQIPSGDTRQCTFLYSDRKRTDGTSSTYTCYIKLIAAEVIDCQLELIRSILDDIEPVEPVGDNPAWPNVEGSNSPYGTSRMNFTQEMYSGVNTDYWVPTLERFAATFGRTGDFNFYSNGRTPKDMLWYLCHVWQGILKDFFDDDVCPLKLRYDTKSYNTYNTDYYYQEEWLFAVIATSGGLTALQTDFYYELPHAVEQLLASSPEDIINNNWNISVPNIDHGYAHHGTRARDNADSSSELKDRWSAWANKCWNHARDLMQTDIGIGTGFDILEKYVERVEEYSNAALNTVGQGDEPDPDNPVVGFVTALLETGNPGQDILQNVNSQQLSLKEVSLARQKGDADQGYVPVADLISENEIKAIKLLFSNKSLVGSEGDNVKSFVVGLPAGLFAENELTEFSIVSNLVDIEYSDLIFRPKAFNFDKDLYVLPEDFDSITSWGRISSFKDLVNTINFTRIRYDVVENDAGTDLEVVQINEKEQATEEDFDLYANHLISTLLESYYKIMVGLEISEDTFTSTDTSLGLAISDYATDLGGAMSALYSSLDSESENLSGLFNVSDKIVSSYDEMVTNFSSEIAAGEFSDLDASMLAKFKDTMSSRLFTAEEMRDRVLSAKVFDRLFFLLLDPDEFYIETSRSRVGNDPYTPRSIVSRYRKQKIIKGSSRNPKLRTRRKSEGAMNFSKFYFSLGDKSDGEGGPRSRRGVDPDLEQIDF